MMRDSRVAHKSVGRPGFPSFLIFVLYFSTSLKVDLILDLIQMAIEAWYMDDSEEDQRLPHKTNPVQPVSTEILDELGVLTWTGILVKTSVFVDITPIFSLILIFKGTRR